MPHPSHSPDFQRPHRPSGIVMVAIVAVFSMLGAVGHAQEAQPKAPAVTVSRLDWPTTNPREQQVVLRLLESPDWPLRVFALLRMERYQGPDVEAMVRGRVTDNSWQVRCFALRQAYQMGYAIAPETLAGESEPYVIRAALRTGVALDPEFVMRGTKKLMRIRELEQLMLGLEIAAASDDEELRGEAKKRVARLIENMDNSISTRIERRLATLLGLPESTARARLWRDWLRENRQTMDLAPPFSVKPAPLAPATEVAMMDAETFSRLLDYLDFLRQRDLEVAIVMDFTSSMLPMINQARAGVDALILFMNDISRTMRLGFVAYRDYDNRPVFQSTPLTDNVGAVRDFLFNMQVTGGRDFPEAVLDGMTACHDMEWTEGAARQIILVGDAPPHDRDIYRLHSLIDAFRNKDFTVHTVHVPLDQAGVRIPPHWIHFNNIAAEAFTEIAYRGGGRMVRLKSAEQLVPAVMHFTLEEGWWPVFDEFYMLYLESCR